MAPDREVSMSTSLLYHAFIRGYDSVRTEYRDGRVIFIISQVPEDRRCPACGSREVISRGHAERHFRSVPIGRRTTTVVLPLPRVKCRACSAVRQVDVPFAGPGRSYTKCFERYALEVVRPRTLWSQGAVRWRDRARWNYLLRASVRRHRRALPGCLGPALWRLDRLSCCRTWLATERLSPSARERVPSFL
jgi:hypothetical protein